jgi:hypothetical protein
MHYIARAAVGIDLGEVRLGLHSEGSHVQLLLGEQRLILPLAALAAVADLARATVRRLEVADLPGDARLIDGRRELGRVAVPVPTPKGLDLGWLFALVDPDGGEVEIVHGCVINGELHRAAIDTSGQALRVARPRLPELVRLLEDAQQALSGFESERAGIVGRC